MRFHTKINLKPKFEIEQTITGKSIIGNVFKILNQIFDIVKERYKVNGLVKPPVKKFQ